MTYRHPAPSRLWVILVFALVIALWVGWMNFGIQYAHSYVMSHLGAPRSEGHRNAPKTDGSGSADGLLTPTVQSMAPDPTADESELAQYGQVGDLFGGLNTLFAAMAFVAVVWAGSLQRIALADARLAYENERNANATAEVARLYERFEATYFRLIDTLHIVEARLFKFGSLAAHVATPRNESADLLHANASIDACVQEIDLHLRMHTATGDCEQIASETRSQLEKLNARTGGALTPYFRLLEYLLELIERVEDGVLSTNAKQNYVEYLKTLLPNSTIYLLALACMSDSNGAMARYARHFSLFEHMVPPKHFSHVESAFWSQLGKGAFRRTAS